jgi:hypothetical protein
MASEKVVPLRQSTQEAFRLETATRPARSGRGPVMTRSAAAAILVRLVADFRSGELQSTIPPLHGRLTQAAAVEPIQPWRPHEIASGITGRYLLGFSLSYEHFGSRGEVYSIRVRVFSDATLRCTNSDSNYNQFVVAIGSRIAMYAREPDIAGLFPEQTNPKAFQGVDFADCFRVTAHPPVRPAVEKKLGKNSDEVLRVGDSIRHADSVDGIGTLSLFVQWQGTDCALGAAHVVARENAKTGTDILWARTNSDQNKPVGRYVHPQNVSFSAGSDAPLDAAIFAINPSLQVEGNSFRRPGKGERSYRVKDFCTIVPSQENRRPPVKIVARGQRIVDAEVVAINASFTAVAANGDLYQYDNMLEIRLPSDRKELPKQRSTLTLGGDSGAGLYVVEDDCSLARYAGMVVCGNGKLGEAGLAYALGSDAIFEGLQLTLRNEGS